MAMGRGNDFAQGETKSERWEKVLKYINTKSTHELAFRTLFKEIMDNEHDLCHQQLRTLAMLYDFTPIYAIAEKSEQDG